MVKVGVVGLGMMGQRHLEAYNHVPDACVVAVADKDESRLAGRKVDSNVENQAQDGYDLSDAKRYTDGMDLINDPDVEMVDLCVVTPLHIPFTRAALKAGKHVLVEKPLARTSDEAQQLLDAEAKAPGLAMCAHCMRFWPEWDWLKQAIDGQRFGKLLSLRLERKGAIPGNPFYHNGKVSGGAVFDLHVHDTDFIQYLFGPPREVKSVGYAGPSGAVDHLTTFYQYDHVPQVVAEGAWVAFRKYPFQMRYEAVFENAMASFDFTRDQPLLLFEQDMEPVPVEVPTGQGYEHELAYFIDCIKTGEKPARSSLRTAMQTLCIIEAEVASVTSGRPEAVRLIS